MKLLNNIILKFNCMMDNIGYKYIIIFCISISAIISIYYSGISLWADELFSTVETNSSMSLLSVVKEASLSDSWPPLYYILLHYIQLLFGDSEFVLRLPSIILNLISIVFVYLLTNQIYSKKEALLSCILFSFSPFILSYSIEVRGYSLFLCLAILSFYLIIKIINNNLNTKYIYTYFSIALLCTLTHYFGLMLVILQIIFLFDNTKNFKKHYLLIAFFIILISIYPFIHLNSLYFKKQIFEHNAIFASNILNREFFITSELISVLFLDKIYVIGKYLLYTSFIFLIFNLKYKSNQFILYFILLPIIIVNLFAYKFMSFLHARYFIFVLPLIYIMISHFMNKILQKYYYIILLCILIFLSCNIQNIEISKISIQDRDNVIFLKEKLIKDSNTVILHSKLYHIEYYLKKYNINDYAMAFFDLSEKEIELLLDNNKTIYILYPFDIQQKDINKKSHKFKIVKIYNKICKIEKTDINI